MFQSKLPVLQVVFICCSDSSYLKSLAVDSFVLLSQSDVSARGTRDPVEDLSKGFQNELYYLFSILEMKIPCWDQIQAVLSPGLYLPTSGG
jgi:hypothetical protein